MDNTPQGSTPVPDPTELTTAAVDRASQQWRRELDGQIASIVVRLDAIDAATLTRLITVDGTITHQREYLLTELRVTEQRITGIETLFAAQIKERDIRGEREARDNKVAVDAAFAAQKEAAAKQDEANSKAIDKSERETAKTIETNAALFRGALDGQNQTLQDRSDRIIKLEAQITTALSHRQEQRSEAAQGISVLVLAFAGLSMLVSLGGLVVSLLR